MATALRLPALPKAIFNPSLHKSILTLWFQDLSKTATVPHDACMKSWWGLGATPDQKIAFDSQCRTVAGAALDVLSPDKFPLPPWKSFEEDTHLAPAISGPLRQVVQDDGVDEPTGDELARADVARSLVILLDQLSRNIFRDAAGQRVVYGHYDRLSRAFVHSMLHGAGETPTVAGLDVKLHAASPAHRVWMYMPLMHSESLPHHDEFSTQVGDILARTKTASDEPASNYIGYSIGFEEKHRSLIERFGRYPHRNKVLGREFTPEEEQYLASGGDTFGTS